MGIEGINADIHRAVQCDSNRIPPGQIVLKRAAVQLGVVSDVIVSFQPKIGRRDSVARFRVNVLRQRGSVSIVLRLIPVRIPSMQELGLPPVCKHLAMKPRGIVLVTGPTGSGKSTTLAAMIDHINKTRTEHIITIEDPIEFVHQNHRCLLNQREVFSHTDSFKAALLLSIVC